MSSSSTKQHNEKTSDPVTELDSDSVRFYHAASLHGSGVLMTLFSQCGSVLANCSFWDLHTRMKTTHINVPHTVSQTQ